MWWLLGEILLCLLIAFILGLIIGWLLCKLFAGKDDASESEREAAKRKQAELAASLDACKKRRAEVEAELKLAREKIEGISEAIDATSAAFAFAAGTAAAAGADEADDGPPVIAAAVTPVPAVAPVPPPSGSKKDDLTKIWGIGKKIAQLLNDNGIFTFAQVAATAEARFREILLASGNKRLHQIANEETWAKQADMAARGDWEALKAYQAKLTWRDGGKA